MTTKNSELIFDLQTFSSPATLQAATSSFNTNAAYNSFDTIGTQMATIGASSGNVNVYGGWVVNDALTNGVINATLYGASDTTTAETINVDGQIYHYGDTVYDHNATFTYYSFSGSNNNSLTIAN